jgi:hypothetical protein
MDCIIFIVDKFLKMLHFIPCNKMNDALVIALTMFFQTIVCLHKVPKTITSNWDNKFLGHFGELDGGVWFIFII